MYLVAVKWSKRFKIAKFRRNLLTFKSHATIVILYWSYSVFDQLANKVLEENYEDLGVENVFRIWWTWHFVEKILLFPIKNIFIIYQAKKNFPDFDEIFGEPYPGTEKPRPVTEGTDSDFNQIILLIENLVAWLQI